MRLHALAPVLLGALLSTAAACETRVSLGAPCTSASQCNGGLICSFGRCRAGCEEQTDCAGSQVCIQATGESAVCTLADDTCGGGNACSAGLVCNVSICAAPCTPTSCVSGSSCRTDSVSMEDVCVRDDVMVADAGSDAGPATDADIDALAIPADTIQPDAGFDRCGLGMPAGGSTATVASLLGGMPTQSIEDVPQLEFIDDGTGPTRIPYSEPYALALSGQRAWLVSTRGVTPNREQLLWEVDNIFDASAVVTAIGIPVGNDVSGADVRLGRDGRLSALFAHESPSASPLFRRIREEAPTEQISISIPGDARRYPQAALFGGFRASGDDSAIAVVVQNDGATPADALLLFPGVMPSATGTRIALDAPSATPMSMSGTQGALAVLNRTTKQVQVLRLGEDGTFPTSWAWRENLQASRIAFTNIPASDDQFLLASISGCDHVLLTQLECETPASCTIVKRVRVPALTWATDVYITPVGTGFAVATLASDIVITWVDANLDVLVPPPEGVFPNPLFPHVMPTASTYGVQRIAMTSSPAGFMAVALYRNTTFTEEARYARRGVRLAP